MGEGLERSRELTERAWQVLTEGYRELAAARRDLRSLGERETAARKEFRRIVAQVYQPPASAGAGGMPPYHPAYAYINQVGGDMYLTRAFLEIKYAEVWERRHREADDVLSGCLIRANAPNGMHTGFMVVGKDGLMRGTRYMQVQGLYAGCDLASGGMYLLARGEQADERCHMYVPLLAEGDAACRRLSNFVIEGADSGV